MAFDRTIARSAFNASAQVAEDGSFAIPDGETRRYAAEMAEMSRGLRLRLALRVNGEIADVPEAADYTAPDGIRPVSGESVLASVHVQDRPGLLKVISDALHQDRPVSAIVRLFGIDGVCAMRIQVWPAAEARTVVALLEPAEGDQTAAPENDDFRLGLLARSELLEIASSLSVLCQLAADVSALDEARPETLRYLSQRLDDAAQLLAALDNPAETDADGDSESLLDLLQDIVGAFRLRAAERHISLRVDIPGAVRQPIPKRFVPLLRLLAASAVGMAEAASSIDIVTRREGQTAAISVTFPAADGAGEQAAFGLAVLRHLALRHGGRLAIVHRQTPVRQWVLRLPLETDANGSGIVRAGWYGVRIPVEQPENMYSSKRGENRA